MWNSGEGVALRGIVNGRLWVAQSVVVVEDADEETILLLTPGAQCAYPDGWWRWKQGDYSQGTRWDDANSNAWTLVIEPLLTWKWKDEDTYHEGIREGCIQEHWAEEIERAKPEIFGRIHERRYPLDGSWINWRPSTMWKPASLPERWRDVR